MTPSLDKSKLIMLPSGNTLKWKPEECGWASSDNELVFWDKTILFFLGDTKLILGSKTPQKGKMSSPRATTNCRGSRIEMTNPNPDTTRLIPLTKGKFAIVDAEDYDFLTAWEWFLCTGYAIRRRKLSEGPGPRTIRMHQAIMGTIEGLEIDHVNGVRSDNRRANLRFCNRSQNASNRPKQLRNTSGYIGVSKTRYGWQAQIRVNGKNIHAGCSKCKIEAAKMYDKAAKAFRGPFAVLNFPEGI